MTPLLTLHEYPPSGNCYKIRLTAAHLGIGMERRAYDILAGETRTAAFRETVSATGRLPVLQIGDRQLPESNAAILWLAEGSDLVPDDRFDRADMMHWLFWEQYSHEPHVATLRFWRAFLGEERLTTAQRDQIPAKESAGAAAMQRLDDHLASRTWLVADRFTLADIALYAYSHVAGEGGLALSRWPAVERRCADVAARPAHLPITA